ncbi:WhiB family transcriptional regulator [Streptomyces sp. NPDC059171]|uniref:WhiB family transcriptional regulator n=1 Tax=Streptomyces sp. NPDC059171 TaxID=3346755 RepID=UPI0036A61972
MSASIAHDTWRDDALCQQTDPKAYYPEAGDSGTTAKQTCLNCPVRRACLDYAVDSRQRWGIWGGVGQKELRRLINARTAA